MGTKKNDEVRTTIAVATTLKDRLKALAANKSIKTGEHVSLGAEAERAIEAYLRSHKH